MYSIKLTLLLLIQDATLAQNKFQVWGFCLFIGPLYSDKKMWVFPHKMIMISKGGGGLCSLKNAFQ